MDGQTSRRQLLWDSLIAALVLFASLGAIGGGRWEEGARDGGADHDLDGLGFGLALAMALPLVGRRLAPLPVLAVVTIATSALYGFGYGFPPLAFAIALYTVARRRDDAHPTRHSLAVAASLVVLVAPSLAREGLGPEVFGGLVVWAGALFAGDRMRLRGVRTVEMRERALEAERAAARERRLATAEERTRIARDLHDSAGHAVNVILVQAGAARLLLDSDPARSREALETIEEVARETLVEIDQLVRALRDAATPDGVEPPAGLAALETLVERSRAAGLEVSVTVEGARRTLSPTTDQAAYRILREALTNAARHGSGGAAQVTLVYGPSTLELTVANPALTTPGADVDGHGIIGMRERAELLGGSVRTGALGGEFRLEASLPYRDPT